MGSRKNCMNRPKIKIQPIDIASEGADAPDKLAIKPVRITTAMMRRLKRADSQYYRALVRFTMEQLVKEYQAGAIDLGEFTGWVKDLTPVAVMVDRHCHDIKIDVPDEKKPPERVDFNLLPRKRELPTAAATGDDSGKGMPNGA